MFLQTHVMFHGIDFATFYGFVSASTSTFYVNLKIFSRSNQNDLTLPETIFELLILHVRRITVRMH